MRIQGLTSVELKLDVREERARREPPSVSMLTEPPDVRVRLDPDTIAVVAEGPKSLIESLSAEDLGAVVYMDGLALVRVLSFRPEEIAARIE